MLKDYSEVHKRHRDGLLVGNGFSIGIHKEFSYPSLYEICDAFLDDAELTLFERFKTQNFERVLEVLNAARQVNEIIGLDTKMISRRYETVRVALIKAVRSVHPRKGEVGEETFERIADWFMNFRNIFTTNYDLLLYWAILNRNTTFVDFFFDNLMFNPTDVELRAGKIGVYYLHGSLFIYREERRTRKFSTVFNLLDSLEEVMTRKRTPVFVSEGATEDKLAAIMSDGYLSYCFDALRDSEGGLTIYGFSLSDNDQHIVDAIHSSPMQRVAYGVYPEGMDIADVEAECLRVRKRLGNKDLVFFD